MLSEPIATSATVFKPSTGRFGRRKSLHPRTINESFMVHEPPTPPPFLEIDGLEFHRGHMTTTSPTKRERGQPAVLRKSSFDPRPRRIRLNRQPSRFSVHHSIYEDRRRDKPTRSHSNNPEEASEMSKLLRLQLRKEQSRLAAQVRRNREGQCLIMLQDALPISRQILGSNVELEKSDVIRIAGQTLFLLHHVCSTLGTTQPAILSLQSRALYAIAVDPKDGRVAFVSPSLAETIDQNWGSLIGTSVQQLIEPICPDHQLLATSIKSRRKSKFRSQPAYRTHGFVRISRRKTLSDHFGPTNNHAAKRKRKQSKGSSPGTAANEGELVKLENLWNRFNEMFYCWSSVTLDPPSQMELFRWRAQTNPITADSKLSSETVDFDAPPTLTVLHWLLVQPIPLLHSHPSTYHGSLECFTVLDIHLRIREMHGNIRVFCSGNESLNLIGQSFLSFIHPDDLEHFTELLETVSMGQSFCWSPIYRVAEASESGCCGYRWIRSLVFLNEEQSDEWICVHQPTGYECDSPSTNLSFTFVNKTASDQTLNKLSLTYKLNQTVISNPVNTSTTMSDLPTSMVLSSSLLRKQIARQPMIKRSGVTRRQMISQTKMLRRGLMINQTELRNSVPVQTKCTSHRSHCPTLIEPAVRSINNPTLSPSNSCSSCSVSPNSLKSSSCSSTSNCPSPGEDLINDALTLTATPLENELVPSVGLASMIEELFASEDLLLDGGIDGTMLYDNDWFPTEITDDMLDAAFCS